jgi:hypothetical protein
MALPARIRSNINMPFPASVAANAPIAMSKNNGIWFINLNMSSLATAPSGTNSDNLKVLVWRVDLDSYHAMPLSQLPWFGKAVTVAELPLPGDVGAGARAFVTDATATTFASIVAGEGDNIVPVYSDATDWRIG